MVISRKAFFAAAIASASSSGARDAATSEPADPEHPEYEELHSLLWFPRGGKRGNAQKIAFIREGVRLGYLSPTHPHLSTSSFSALETFNFLARSRVQVDATVQAQLAEADRVATAARGEDIVVLLPESVSTYISTDGGDFLLTRPQGRIALSHVQVSEAKFLFVDHHQVLDRHWEECALTTERIPPQNLEVLRHLKEDSAEQRWIFVLSYVHSGERLESVVQQWNRAEAQDLISGIIFTREPLVKVAVIQTFLDSLGDHRGDRETAILVDDKVEIIEHLRQTFDPEEVKGVHIKLKRKRQSEGCDEYVQANFFADHSVQACLGEFLRP